MATVNIAESIAETRNYPYNCWWVAALGNEVGRTLLGRWLLDTPVVLFRQEDGTVVALEDRCPHRQAPLSLGRLRGDTIECGYHGFCFDATGRCVRVPSADEAPAFSAKHYPVKEVGPFVWIWVGDPAMIDTMPAPPELHWANESSFATRSGQMEISANYMLLKENVLDLTHFGYVHASTFQIEDWTSPPEVRVSGDGDTVEYRQRFVNKPLAPGYAMALGVPPGTPWHREHRGSFLSPALQEGCVDFEDPSRPESAPSRFRVAHATTPIDQTHMLYCWVIGRDFATAPEAMDHLVAAIRTGFDEDREVLEAIQAQAGRRPRRASAGERSVKADAAGIQARRIVARWMERDG
ncbi:MULTISPECIES: aromatic ring-hydroxylating dioxygenase subunit alpha [unclassified Burkholderia]|uniref:aromatic ring-hydroxylating dioxygenase subunit alpha n=1 Tax=unclassified Burkholderia TaxID=2613784 RepID=UPI002ABDD3E1|nr:MULTISPECIES: aromatic ring-hydroxylating dioxygenase subunit alpha [unclassified Burkholderia]